MRSITWIALCAVVCLTFVTVSTVSAAEVKFDKVEYFPPKAEGQKKSAEPVKGHVIFDKEKKVIEVQDANDHVTLNWFRAFLLAFCLRWKVLHLVEFHFGRTHSRDRNECETNDSTQSY